MAKLSLKSWCKEIFVLSTGQRGPVSLRLAEWGREGQRGGKYRVGRYIHTKLQENLHAHIFYLMPTLIRQLFAKSTGYMCTCICSQVTHESHWRVTEESLASMVPSHCESQKHSHTVITCYMCSTYMCTCIHVDPIHQSTSYLEHQC